MRSETKRPDISVKVILRARDKILMFRRNDGSYDFPGGRMEWGESPEDTARRELLEELAYTLPAIPKFLDIYNYISKDGSRHSLFLHYFLNLNPMPTLTTTTEEPDASVVWLTREEMLQVINDSGFVSAIYDHP